MIFRSFGKHPNPQLEALQSTVQAAGTEIWVPAAVYHELADSASPHSSTNPYLDPAIEAGWLRVVTPLPGDRDAEFDSHGDPVENARVVAEDFLNQRSKYPETNNWRDAALVALAVRLFEGNTRIHEGKEVSVYAYRSVEGARWYLGRSCCLDCAPVGIATPTLGTAECQLTAQLIVQSDVTEQRHRLVLADPEVAAFAPPGDGTTP